MCFQIAYNKHSLCPHGILEKSMAWVECKDPLICHVLFRILVCLLQQRLSSNLSWEHSPERQDNMVVQGPSKAQDAL